MPERYIAVLELVKRKGTVAVEEIASTFGISESTARRDLAFLASRNLLRRIHGGAVSSERNGHVLPFNARLEQDHDEKLRIARAAAGFVKPGMQIAVDGGTTTSMLVPFILHVDRLTVITNSLQTASELTANDNIKVFALGGEVDAVSLSTSGSWTTSQLEDVRVDVAFLGVAGVHTEAGLSSGLFEQVHTKRSLIARANRTIVLADHTKIGQTSLFVVTPLSAVSSIITGVETPEDEAAQIASCGPKVLRA
ncbi:MAG: DeoR/GlpR family DNA-binding transcription regulator [Bacillota bacterium]|jgi:DeoR family fructose operon transcriptional repressor